MIASRHQSSPLTCLVLMLASSALVICLGIAAYRWLKPADRFGITATTQKP